MSHWMTSGRNRLKAKEKNSFAHRAQSRAAFMGHKSKNRHRSNGPREVQTCHPRFMKRTAMQDLGSSWSCPIARRGVVAAGAPRSIHREGEDSRDDRGDGKAAPPPQPQRRIRGTHNFIKQRQQGVYRTDYHRTKSQSQQRQSNLGNSQGYAHNYSPQQENQSPLQPGSFDDGGGQYRQNLCTQEYHSPQQHDIYPQNGLNIAGSNRQPLRPVPASFQTDDSILQPQDAFQTNPFQEPYGDDFGPTSTSETAFPSPQNEGYAMEPHSMNDQAYNGLSTHVDDTSWNSAPPQPIRNPGVYSRNGQAYNRSPASIDDTSWNSAPTQPILNPGVYSMNGQAYNRSPANVDNTSWNSAPPQPIRAPGGGGQSKRMSNWNMAPPPPRPVHPVGQGIVNNGLVRSDQTQYENYDGDPLYNDNLGGIQQSEDAYLFDVPQEVFGAQCMMGVPMPPTTVNQNTKYDDVNQDGGLSLADQNHHYVSQPCELGGHHNVPLEGVPVSVGVITQTPDSQVHQSSVLPTRRSRGSSHSIGRMERIGEAAVHAPSANVGRNQRLLRNQTSNDPTRSSIQSSTLDLPIQDIHAGSYQSVGSSVSGYTNSSQWYRQNEPASFDDQHYNNAGQSPIAFFRADEEVDYDNGTPLQRREHFQSY